MPRDYTILAPARISRRTFRVILERRHSPAADDAGGAYAAALDYGVDPAVLLAVFQHESGYGRAGVATHTRSWGNLRRSPLYPTPRHCGFVHYPSWAAGARDAARLLRIYGKNDIRPGRDTSTVRKFPHVWAPKGDGHNDPDAYGAALVRAIDGYIALDRQLAGEDDEPRAATHATPYTDVRIRAGASLRARILRTVDAGAEARATIVEGKPYRVDGRSSTRWLRITVLGGRRLADPVYSAALLWRQL